MMFTVAIPGLDGVDSRFLAGLQHYKKVAFPVGDGTKFVKTKVDFVYVTGPKLRCPYHASGGAPDVLRQIADHEIGANAPHLADELHSLADRLEKEMSGDK